MVQTRISQLEIIDRVRDTDYFVIDNTEVTRRVTAEVVQNKIRQSFDTTFTNLTSQVVSSFEAIVTDFEELSTFVDEKFNKVTLRQTSNDIIFLPENSGEVIHYSGSTNISAFITPNINTQGYTTTVAQLSTGTITLMLSSSYTDGSVIAYGDLVETAGPGATANVIRINNNAYLITGLLQ
jgi:hypothetical protein